MHILKVQTPDGRDRARFLAAKRLIIGRDASCDVVLVDTRVSRRHASLVKEGDDAFLLEDLGSTNGTMVRGFRIKQTRLTTGDRFQIGSVQFEIDDMPESTTLSHDTEEDNADDVAEFFTEATDITDVSDL